MCDEAGEFDFDRELIILRSARSLPLTTRRRSERVYKFDRLVAASVCPLAAPQCNACGGLKMGAKMVAGTCRYEARQSDPLTTARRVNIGAYCFVRICDGAPGVLKIPCGHHLWSLTVSQREFAGPF